MNKVRVYGKAQNRTALGIAHAYTVMYPHATLADLRKAFPNSICPDSGVKELFLPVAEAETFNTKMSLYFAKPDEVLTLGDGSQVALAQVWSKPSFERMVEQGKLYDVEVAEFEKTAHPGQRGGYRLEYLNGYVPPVPEKKKSLAWLWILLGLIAVGVIIFLCMPRGEKVVEVEKIVEKEVIVRDTVYVQQIEAIEKDFNTAQFEKGQAELNDDAKLALHDLAKVMKQNDALRLRIEGHTSAEGDAAVNQKLSEDRAQAAVDFLVNKEGIDASRLEAVGKGSSEPIDPATPEANRRTEFVILD
ncbi:MAG: OmpA family protein [Duncaniella sp.]|nr:OmpA family protein [Duncaniella sp.]MDE6496903.1 OmpA family protein [Duncaniella sp.]